MALALDVRPSAAQNRGVRRGSLSREPLTISELVRLACFNQPPTTILGDRDQRPYNRHPPQRLGFFLFPLSSLPCFTTNSHTLS